MGVPKGRAGSAVRGFRRSGAVIGLVTFAVALVLAPSAGATGSSATAPSATSRARHQARVAYRHRSRLVAHRGHWTLVHYRHQRPSKSAPRARAAVVGGTESSIEALPWQAVVFAKFVFEGETFGLLCGGSIVDATHVVTAGHCVFNFFTGERLAASSFSVVAGVSTLSEKEIKEGPTSQPRLVSEVRAHPYFNSAAGPGTPDDIAVLQLSEALKASSAVKPIALPSTTAAPAEGSSLSLSGYGIENETAEEINGRLYSLGTSVVFSRRCGGPGDALFVCASAPGGSACNGDSGGPVVAGSPARLVGIVDIVQELEGQFCRASAVNGFVNLAAPEVRDFIDGSEAPPLAPRGGGVVVEGVLVVGHSLVCRPGSWSGNPTFTYAFVDGASGRLLQQGPSATYALGEGDVGRTILCQLQASNAGGTGVARTFALPPIKPAPPPPPPPPESPASAPGGSVLSSTSQHIGAEQIQTLLAKELTPTGKGAKIASLLKAGGWTITFEALEAGIAVLQYYQLPPGAKLAKANAKPVLVAAGRASFSAAGTMKLKVKLTSAGKRLLKHRRGRKLTAKGTFTPAGEGPVSATKTFVLKA
jgi:trypsin